MWLNGGSRYGNTRMSQSLSICYLYLYSKDTLSHELLLGHVDDINPAIHFHHTLSNGINIHQPGFHSFNILAISQFEPLTALGNRYIWIITAAAQTPHKGAPGFETPEDVAAALLGGLEAVLLLVARDVLKGRGGVHVKRFVLGVGLQTKYYYKLWEKMMNSFVLHSIFDFIFESISFIPYPTHLTFSKNII